MSADPQGVLMGGAKCPSCGARVFWAHHHKTKKRAMVDPEPMPTGNVLVEGSMYHVLKAERVETLSLFGDEPEVGQGLERWLPERHAHRYVLHFVTCSDPQGLHRCETCHQSPCTC